MEELKEQHCPMCQKKTMTLMEDEKEIPYFGKIYLFSMTCTECKYHKADVECAQVQEPIKYTLEIESEEDMNIRIVRSSTATIKIPHITTITPGPSSNGYVTNVEGIFARVKSAVETTKNIEDDKTAVKKAKNMLKKIQKIIWGQEKAKIIIEDPTGNSAIISDKAKKEKLKLK